MTPADKTLAKYSWRSARLPSKFSSSLPKAVHVEGEVSDTAMQERIAHELPRHEAGLQRPQGETGDHILTGAGFQQEASYRGNEESSNTGRHSAHVNLSS